MLLKICLCMINRKFPDLNRKPKKVNKITEESDMPNAILLIEQLLTEGFFDNLFIDNIGCTFDFGVFHLKTKLQMLKRSESDYNMYCTIIQDFVKRELRIIVFRKKYGDDRDFKPTSKNPNNISEGLYREVLFKMGNKDAYF